MAFSEDKFKKHIRQVVQNTSPDSDRPLTLSELRELAEKMGVSEREWDELMLKAEDSLNEAVGHLRVENYTDAVLKAEEATSINPYIKDGNAILAQSYYKLALVDQNDALFEKAIHHAKMELKQDPLDSVALNVLSASQSLNKESKYSKKMVQSIGVGIGAIVLLLAVLFMCNRADEPEHISTEAAQVYEVKKAKYITAIERRNEDALEIVGQIQSSSLRRKFKNALTHYDFSAIQQSEQNYRLLLSEVKAEITFPKEMKIRLESGNNRINVEKKRYEAEKANYREFLLTNQDDIENAKQILEELE